MVSHGAILNAVDLSPDGSRFLTAGTDGRVVIWDAVAGTELAVLAGHAGSVRVAQFSPDGRRIITGDDAGTAQLWDVADALAAGANASSEDGQSLRPDGPWWVYDGAAGLWASNPDGTGMTQLADRALPPAPPSDAWVAPAGGRIAYVTAEDERFNATLHVVSLSAPAEALAIPLTSPETEPSPDAAPGDATLDALQAVLLPRSFAWAPDGQRLAFAGILAGPTVDVYVYNVKTESTIRLTDGPTQAAGLRWSPDGRTILHEALTGSAIDTGFRVAGLWAAPADGSAVSLALEGAANFAGWVGEEVFLAYAVDLLCGRHDVRLVDLDSGATQPVWEGYFDHVAADPETGAILIAVRAETAASEWCNNDDRDGLFLVSGDGTPLPVVEGDVSALSWSPAAGLFFARSNHGVIAISTTGQFIDLVVPETVIGFPEVAPGSRTLAWVGEGLWLGALTNNLEQPPQQLARSPVRWARWFPDGTRLLFADLDGTIYMAAGPAFEIAQVSTLPGLGAPVWVAP
jgi:WD40 repeat protein